MLRVLVGGFGEVARRGIAAILSSPEFVIDECSMESVMSIVAATRPDVLVIDTSAVDLDRARLVATAYPTLTVIACSASDDTIRTFARCGDGRCIAQPLSAASLLNSVRNS